MVTGLCKPRGMWEVFRRMGLREAFVRIVARSTKRQNTVD
jgi:hypothetical protein